MNRAHVVCLAFLLSSPAWSAESIKYLALVDGGTKAGAGWFFSPTARRFVNRPKTL